MTETSEQTIRIANISIFILAAGRYYCHLPPGCDFFICSRFPRGRYLVWRVIVNVWVRVVYPGLVVTVRIRVDVSVRVRVSKLLGSD